MPYDSGFPQRMLSIRLESAARGFASDVELAQALRVDLVELERWRAGAEPTDDASERVVALDVTVELLSTYLSPSSIPKWLNGLNSHLGERRPIRLLADGRLSKVIAAIEAEKSGVFA